jgi:DNA-binding transcriptional ArsR family regulator
LQTNETIDFSTLRSWTFLTSHAQILLALVEKPEATVAELAAAAHVTERTAYRILADLQKAGYVRRRKVGRENRYEINHEQPLHDPMVEDGVVGDLLRLAAGEVTRQPGQVRAID